MSYIYVLAICSYFYWNILPCIFGKIYNMEKFDQSSFNIFTLWDHT